MECDKCCIIGQNVANKCHGNYYSKKSGYKAVNSIHASDKQLIMLRSSIQICDTDYLCFEHEAMFLTRYESNQKYCANPFNKHNHVAKTSLPLWTLIWLAKLLINVNLTLNLAKNYVADAKNKSC